MKNIPDHKWGPAVRNHYLIHYAVAGCGTYTVDGTTYALRAGQGFLIEPFVITTYQADHDDPWEYYWFGFYGGEASYLITEAGLNAPNLVFRSPLRETRDILAEMNTINAQGNTNRCEMLSLLYRFFSVYHKNLPQRPQRQLLAEPHRNPYVAAAVDYIEHNYNYDISVTDIARHIGLDRSYLYRLFCSDLGCSPQQYLIDFRLRAALHMFGTNEYSITEIACSCGFSSLAHFSSTFKKKYGLPPIRYKDLI